MGQFSLLIALCTSACIILCTTDDAQLSELVSTLVDSLNTTDFRNGLALKSLEVIQNYLRGSQRREFGQMFMDQGGFSVWLSWVEVFKRKNMADSYDHRLKQYVAEMLDTVAFAGSRTRGAVCDTFARNIMTSELLGRLIELLNQKTLLFQDANYTEGAQRMCGSILMNLDFNCTNMSTQSYVRKWLGGDISKIRRVFRYHPDGLMKLNAAALLALQSNTEFSGSEEHELCMDDESLLHLRSDFLTKITKLRGDPTYRYKLGMSSQYFSTTTGVGNNYVRFFNCLLLCESNRLQICDEQTFAFYFFGVSLFVTRSNDYENSEDELCIHSLRALVAMAKTCPNYSRFFSKNQLGIRTITQMKQTRLRGLEANEATNLLNAINSGRTCPTGQLHFTADVFGIKSCCHTNDTDEEFVETVDEADRSIVIKPTVATEGAQRYASSQLSQPVKATIIASTLLCLLAFISVVLVLVRERRIQMNNEQLDFSRANHEGQFDLVPTDFGDTWLVPQIKLESVELTAIDEADLQCGFRRSKIRGMLDVVIKLANEHNQQELLREAQIIVHSTCHMSIIVHEHSNVHRMLATVSDTSGFRHLILEAIHMGCLHDLIPKFRINYRIKSFIPVQDNTGKLEMPEGDLYAIAFQIADGMTFMSGKQLIHRDLSTRNIFVTENFVVKIGNFGLAKRSGTIYFSGDDAQVPSETAAPEAIVHLTFSQKSDVFSFGVLLMELFSLGQTSSAEIAEIARNSPKQLENLHHVQADASTWSLIQKCLNTYPGRRPNFEDCRKHFERKTPRQLMTELLEECSQDLINWRKTQVLLKEVAVTH